MMKKLMTTLWTVGCCLLAAGGLAQEATPQLQGDPDNPVTLKKDAHEYYSMEGDFRVTWPSGCGSLTTRTPQESGLKGAGAQQEYPMSVFCDRHGEKGEGCSVLVVFNARSSAGDPAGPPEVLTRLRAKLQSFGADIVRQQPLAKDFGNGIKAEGIDILAAQPGGSGQVWLRGFLIGSDIFIMSAWDLGGELWSDPEYATFFNSFNLGAE
jgi:hypothetical protein